MVNVCRNGGEKGEEIWERTVLGMKSSPLIGKLLLIAWRSDSVSSNCFNGCK